MSRFGDILNHPNYGLLPYLDAQLADDYNRFLIRPYAFGTTSLRSGFRLRDRSCSFSEGRQQVTQGVLIGRMIIINSAINSQIAAARLAQDIDSTVNHWSRCICPAVEIVDQFQGAIAVEALKGVSSDQPNALWSVVIRSFDVRYTE